MIQYSLFCMSVLTIRNHILFYFPESFKTQIVSESSTFPVHWQLRLRHGDGHDVRLNSLGLDDWQAQVLSSGDDILRVAESGPRVDFTGS